MRKLFLLIFIFYYITASAQNTALDFSNSISPDSIKSYLFTLASDSMEGRETGRRGQKMASYYISGKYKFWGIAPKGYKKESDSLYGGKTNDYFQDHPISIRSNKAFNLSIGTENYLYGRDFIYSPGSTDSAITIHEMLFIGINKKTNFQDNTTTIRKQNNYLILPGKTGSRIDLIKSLLSVNANASSLFLIVGKDEIKKYFVESDVPGNNLAIPVFYITDSVAAKIFPAGKFFKTRNKMEHRNKLLFKEIKCEASVRISQNPNQLRGQNVVALIPGTDLNNESIVISAHYDHLGIRDSLIYPGADDDGSGTSAVLELARVFTNAKSEGYGPRRNILLLNVSGEEKGLLGSSWFVSNPTIPLETIVADLNIDMIGRTDSIHDSTGVRNYVYVIGADKLSSELNKINEEQNNAGPKLELNYKYNSPDDPNRFYRRSDHYNFAKNNIPIIFYFDGKHADYHKPSDTPDKIDYDQLASRARLVFLTAWELANRNDRLLIDKKNDLLK